ncbi:MAG: response regulator [bacterium]
MHRPGQWTLVVDPDPRAGHLCADVLGGLGAGVHAVQDGVGALDAVEALGPPAAVVTELALPDMDAFALVQRLRRLAGPGLSVVVLTRQGSARSASRALSLGFDGYLLKDGNSVEELRSTVRRATRRRMHQAELERVVAELTKLNEVFMASMGALRQANLELDERLARASRDDHRAWRVLVVDDDVTIVALLETLLRSQGHEVDGATSGAAAREAFLRRPYDLVLTDKNLGDANGVELIREVHAVHPEARVILMTGYPTLESAVDAIESGVAGLLRKPFDDLGLVVQRVEDELATLGGRQAERRYFDDFRARHAEFEARFRLIRNKLATLQHDAQDGR